MKASVTPLLKYELAEVVKSSIFPTYANTYVCIGRPIRWGDAVDPEANNEIEDVAYSTNYRNQVYRDMVAMKRISASDTALVVPRVDWTAGIHFDEYRDHLELFTHNEKLVLGTVNANSNVVLSGTVNSSSNVVVGTGTYFTGNLFAGDVISVNNYPKQIITVTNNDHLVVNTTFAYSGVGNTLTVVANNLIVRSNGAVFSGNIFTGNTVAVAEETKEVVVIKSPNVLVLNTALSGSYSSNVSMIRISNTYPKFANNFYVRNSKDQVFKCLFNANDAISTTEPTIDIDGQLPENPYIETADGYKWKYLYTIPYGLKQKFFTKNWMPVVSDASVVAGSVNGRLDVIHILDGGSGYFLNNGEAGNSNSLYIITVTGDGAGATVTAKVESGVITDLNILSGGAGYTFATVTADDPDQLANGTTAVFDASISPYGGHGSNPVKELGCYSVMTAVDLVGSETDTIPVGGVLGDFDFRQISVIRDPLLANGSFAEGSVYRTTTKFSLTDPGITNFLNDETVYIGTSVPTADFTATVVAWDPSTNELFVNNLAGNVSVGATITGNNSAAVSTVLGVEAATVELFTGDVLYIENRQKVVRDVEQTEQIRLVLSF